MRGMSVAALVSVGVSAAVCARPSGLPVEMVETFNRFTPGVPASQQGVTPGCPAWGGGWVAQLRPGSTSDVLMERPVGAAGSVLQAQLSFGVFADGTTNAVVRSELFAPSLAALSQLRLTSTGAGFATSSAMWGGLQFESNCSGQLGTPAPQTTFFVTDVCPGSTSGQFVNSHVQVPQGAWFRLEHRVEGDGTLVWTLDPMDGSGAVELLRSVVAMPGGSVSAIRFDQSETAAGESLRVDNVAVAGLSTRPACPGDATRNGTVNFADLNEILSAFGQTGNGNALAADVNGDGIVNFGDLNITLSAFGTQCGCVP